VYYLFRGLRGISGEPVIGRLSAMNEEAVYKMLDAHAITAEAVYPEDQGGLFPPSIQAVLDEIGVRITFKQMPKVHEGGDIWILDRQKLPGRVMRLAQEVCGYAADRQPVMHRLELLLETHFGDRPAAPATAPAGAADGHFANADEVRAEMNRLRAAIKSLERELIAMKSRPYAGPRHSGAKKTTRDRTQDEVLREIFEHNLELMKLTSTYGITGLADK